MGSKLRELESLGVDGRHWETSGDTNSGCWKGLESPGVAWRRWKTLGVVETVVVHSPTNHLGFVHRCRLELVGTLLLLDFHLVVEADGRGWMWW